VHVERAEAAEKDSSGEPPPPDADTEWLSEHYDRRIFSRARPWNRCFLIVAHAS